MTSASRLLLALLAALPFVASAAEIYRCTSPAGAVTYQQDPCAAREDAKVIDVPSQYPAADSSERERLFVREAALDRRLEAERERQSRQAIARAAAPAPLPAPAVDAAPEVLWIVPPAVRHGSRMHAGHRAFRGARNY